MKEQIKKITITRAEGYTDECITAIAKNFAQADYVIRMMAQTAPTVADGGYDKTDFHIEWNDGQTYTGRIDLRRFMAEGYDFAAHIRLMIDARVTHDVMTAEQGVNFIDKYVGWGADQAVTL